MTTELTLVAGDRSSYVVTVSFEDEDGDPVTPLSAEWTLTNELGVVINTRDGEEITPLAASVEIVLGGADLAWSDGQERFLVIEAKYNGVVNNMDLTGQASFTLDNYKHIS